jgi:peptidyl-prolyl isomerase D
MEFEDFSDVKEPRSDVFEVRVEKSNEYKEKGNSFYKLNDLANAEICYHTGLYHINFDSMQWNFELLDNHRETVLKSKVPICLNLAAVRIKLQKYEKAIELCDEVLKDDKTNPKAFYRKAQAQKELKNYESALESITKAEQQAKDSSISSLKQEIKKLLRKENEKYKKMWKGKLIPKPKIFTLSRLLSIFNPFNLHFRLFPLVI